MVQVTNILSRYYEELYTNKSENIHEMECLWKHSLSAEEEIENMNVL